MTILRQKIAEHSRLRLVLMSATMQEDMFSRYFDNCPLISVEGRTFPVAIKYVDDALRFVRHQSPGGVFRPDTSRNANRGVGSSEMSRGHFDADLVAELVAAIMSAPEDMSSTTETTSVSRVAEPRGNCVLIFLSGIGSIQTLNTVLSRKLKSHDSYSKTSVGLVMHLFMV